MRILVIGPRGPGGSLPPYLDALADGLRALGVEVERLGSSGVPYDAAEGRFHPVDRIVASAYALLDGIDLDSYDLLSVHFGNLEVEQVLPAIWRRRAPAVYHVHSLDWTLFSTHVKDRALRCAVEEGVRSMDGFAHFGEYSRAMLPGRFGVARPEAVAWLPTTIPTGTEPVPPVRLRDVLPDDAVPALTLYGYAAPWKDPGTLLAASARVSTRCRIVLAGPFWDDPAQAGVDLRQEVASPVRHGAAEVAVLPGYLDPRARRALVESTTFAVFPYRPHSAFQGSGAVADYLAHGVPVLASDLANFAELIGDAGVVVPACDPGALARAIDRLADAPLALTELAEAARGRAAMFTAAHHAAACLDLYERVTAGRSRPRRS